jgi:hypothetical protein
MSELMTAEEASALIEVLAETPPKSLDGARLGTAVLVVAENWRVTRTGLSMAGVDGAPDWLGFETALWRLSERLRPVISARKDWRSGSEIMHAVLRLCRNQSYAKGRQNFVLTLGDFGGANEAAILGDLLTDTDVQGHAIKALCKLRDDRFRAVVERVMPSLKGWSKSAAKKYLAPPPAPDSGRLPTLRG